MIKIEPHDPAYCDQYRPRGHGCNQPHAAADPHGARRPLPADIQFSPFTRRAMAAQLPAKEYAR